jgi:RNA polymerase sigma-70 factor (ECF subfamily)
LFSNESSIKINILKPHRPITILFKEINEGSQPAFDELFLNYYNRWVAFAQQYVKRQEYAEEITLDLFVKLWLKRKELSQILNPQVYLFVAVKNASLNQLRGITKSSGTSIDSEEYISLSSPDNSGPS